MAAFARPLDGRLSTTDPLMLARASSVRQFRHRCGTPRRQPVRRGARPGNTASGIWADTSHAAMPGGHRCARARFLWSTCSSQRSVPRGRLSVLLAWRDRWRRSRSPISPTTRAGRYGMTAEPHPPGLPYSEAVNRISSGSARRQRSSRSAHTAQWRHGVDPRPSTPPTRGV